MRRPVRALFDPEADQLDLRGGEPSVRVGRGHEVVGIRRGDAQEDLALLGLSGRDRAVASEIAQDAPLRVEAQVCLPRLCVGSVALEAVLRKDRADVAVEVQLLRGHDAPGMRGAWGGERAECDGKDGVTHLGARVTERRWMGVHPDVSGVRARSCSPAAAIDSRPRTTLRYLSRPPVEGACADTFSAPTERTSLADRSADRSATTSN